VVRKQVARQGAVLWEGRWLRSLPWPQYRRTDSEQQLHVIVFGEASLYQHVKLFLGYHHESRTHLSLAKDAPEPRLVHPPELERVVAIRQVGGLHHRCERRTA
jgi:hypothetical protein